MEDFVPFELAVKLKEKGFSCKYPFAIYFGNRMYYDYGDLIDDKDAIIAPTISQVLKLLREKYSIHISTKPYPCEDGLMWLYELRKFNKYISAVVVNKTGFTKEEQAALAGIEYTLDNLI